MNFIEVMVGKNLYRLEVYDDHDLFGTIVYEKMPHNIVITHKINYHENVLKRLHLNTEVHKEYMLFYLKRHINAVVIDKSTSSAHAVCLY